MSLSVSLVYKFFEKKYPSNYVLSLLTYSMLIGVASSCKFRMSDKKIYRSFVKETTQPQVRRYKALGKEINYVEVGDDSLPTVIFIHGAPGSLSAFMSFLKDSTLQRRAKLISVDRPGYGFSSFGKAVTSIEEQAALIRPILEQNQHPQPPILVGHSYGGTVIARLAMDYPELVGALVMAAPAIDPENEKIFWISYPADWWMFRWMVPRILQVTNDEKLSHVNELKKMQPNWEKVQAPTTFIHGEKDKLVPIANSKFGAKQMTNAQVDTIYDAQLNHLIPWKRPDLIKQAIFKYLDEME